MSLLAAQLQKRARSSTTVATAGAFNVSDKRRIEPSILFSDPKSAADKDKEAIFHIGCNGLAELMALEPERFRPYFDTLFGDASLAYDRALHTSEANAALDKSIERFLEDVAPFLLRCNGVLKCLEWLLRRFKIQLFNTDALIRLILPVHETTVWTKISAVIDFR